MFKNESEQQKVMIQVARIKAHAFFPLGETDMPLVLVYL